MIDLASKVGSIVAIPVPWEHSASGCVEWKMVDWCPENDEGPAIPVLEDAAGEEGAWADDYAIQVKAGEWVFPDGERTHDDGLAAAFARRARTVQ